MAIVSVKIPKAYRRSLFITLTVSWCTGIAFFIFSRYITIDGDFGPEKHPWQFPVLMMHGVAAFLMMMACGSLLTNHVPSGWRQNKLRLMGLTLVAFLVLQVVSAYLLYYLSSDEIRAVTSNIHAASGFLFPLLLIAHIVHGKRLKTRATTARPEPVPAQVSRRSLFF
ncbi:MAG: hypothetical protein V7745_01130 [Pseudomonadales bacterium]